MANSDIVKGLVPVGYLNGAPYNGQVNKYYIPDTDSTAVFVGDPVKLAGSADSRGIPSVAQASVGDAIIGAVVGIAEATRDDDIYRAASTEKYVLVADDPQTVFEVQEDSDGGALAATDVGQNASFIVGTGSTVTGLSGVELDSSTAATTSTLDLQILRLSDREDNEIGTNAKWLVKLNNHQFTNAATGI